MKDDRYAYTSPPCLIELICNALYLIEAQQVCSYKTSLINPYLLHFFFDKETIGFNCPGSMFPYSLD
jgi:hypothetical protein